MIETNFQVEMKKVNSVSVRWIRSTRNIKWKTPEINGGYPDVSAGKESACSAGDAREADLIPGSGRSYEGGNGNPFKYSCLKNSIDREPGRL